MRCDKENWGLVYGNIINRFGIVTVMAVLLLTFGTCVCAEASENTDKQEYSIIYELNGGSFSCQEPEKYIAGAVTKLNKPSKAGYKFAGWYTTEKYEKGTRIAKIGKESQGDIRLYAFFKPYKYKVTYNFGQKGIKKLKHKGIITDVLLKNTHLKDGYIFKGWRTGKKGSGKLVLDGAAFHEVFEGVKKKSITLYAEYEKEVPQMLIDEDCGIDVNPNQPVLDGAIYVAEDGDDAASGTKESPYGSVQKALQEVSAGQAIYIRGGSYTGSNKLMVSGSEEKGYIVISSYPGEKAFLTLAEGKSGAVIDTNGMQYVKIRNLDIGGLNGAEVYGVLMNGGEHHIYVEHNDIHDIVTTKPKNDGEANAVLCLGEGVTEEETINNIYIEKNKVYSNVNGWSENISIAGNCENILVSGNAVYNCTNIGIDFYGNAGYCKNSELDQPRYCKAENNKVYNCVCDYAECAGIYVDGGHDIEIINNVSCSNQYGIEVGSEEAPKTAAGIVRNVLIKGNEVYGNSFCGVKIGGYTKGSDTGVVTNVIITKNKFTDNGEGEEAYNGEICFEKSDGIQITENDFYKSNSEYPFIGAGMNGKYVKNLLFSQNTYHSSPDAESICFELPIGSKVVTVEGLDSFNALEFVNGEKFEIYANNNR